VRRHLPQRGELPAPVVSAYSGGDCELCHGPGAFGGGGSGDGCLSCHGPDDTCGVGPGPKHVPWPWGTTPGGSGQPDEGNERTSLLRSDNRGARTLCHQK
jgi:hypothetical protein